MIAKQIAFDRVEDKKKSVASAVLIFFARGFNLPF